MKNFIKLILILSITMLASQALAKTTRIYIDDNHLDYNLENFKETFDENTIVDYTRNKDLDQAENLRIYTHFELVKPGGELRVHLDTTDRFASEMPVVLATLPDGNDELDGITFGVEIIQTQQKDTGIKFSLEDITLDEAKTVYLDKFTSMNYTVLEMDENSYQIVREGIAYSIDFSAKDITITNADNSETTFDNVIEVVIAGVNIRN